MRKLAILLFCCCACQAQAQDLLRYEPFDYTPVGGAIEGQTNPDGATWVGAYGPAPPATPVPPGNIKIGSGSLAMPAELDFGGIGNSAEIDFSDSSVATNLNHIGKAIRLPLGTTVTTGTVYYSLALRVDDLTGALPNTGGFIVALNNSAGATTQNPTAGAARLQAHVDPLDPAKYELSVLRNRPFSAVGDTTWSGGLTVGETLFIVASIEIVAGTQNDVARLWINPGDLGAETAPAATITDVPPTETPNGTDINIASIILRQGPAPSVTLDELRVGTTWASVTSAAIIPEFDEGDFDEDFDVDADDLALWTGDFGLQGTATHGDGDADGDLDVDGADFLVWQQQLGNVPPPPVASIPEPASLLLAMIAVGATPVAAARVSRSRKR